MPDVQRRSRRRPHGRGRAVADAGRRRGSRSRSARTGPLLFGGGLLEQYALARDVHGFDDTGLADLARASVRASGAPRDVKERLLDGIERWLG
ncbi:MAG: hypothetical protein ACM3ZF_03560 [Mycobacterium leprae]